MNLKAIIYFGLLTTILASCVEEFGGPGEPFNRKEQVSGTWKVTTMIQRDLVTSNPEQAELDITEVYSFDEYTLTLNSDGTFSTENPGDAPAFIMSSGNWALDDDKFPTAILLTSEGGSATLAFQSLNSLTERNELQVSFTRKVVMPEAESTKEVEVIAYQYTLSNQ